MASSFIKNVVGTGIALAATNVLLSPAVKRLTQGGVQQGLKQNNSANPNITYNTNRTGKTTDDWRIRLSLAPGNGIFYQDSNSNILKPLADTRGVVFPYTPNITVAYQSTYGSQRFTHGNYTHFAYENTEVQQIQLQADFTAQNRTEAAYVLACVYFFRAASKMFFGNGKYAGNPPPILYLNGYGKYYFNNVPCILTTFNHAMPNEVDYIDVALNESDSYIVKQGDNETTVKSGIINKGPSTRIPVLSQMTVTLQPIYSKQRISEFDLNEFAKGNLINKGFL
jgi:hypothetical protein